MATWHGILNVAKPGGWTSHDVVGRVRRILGQREVGHAGTLDPMATGVLLVCVGQATRVSEYLMVGEKVYRAGIRLGLTTDTYDLDGRVIAEAPVPPLSAPELGRTLAPFIGEIWQAPPAYSAIKQDGVPLHRRARRGEAVEVQARRVRIDRIDLLDWQTPDLTLEVTCGPGTYVRSLAHDLGQALGCGAALSALARLRSGRFTLAEALSLDALAEAAAHGALPACLQPASAALSALIRLSVDGDRVTRLGHGLAISGPAAADGDAGYAEDPQGGLVAILVYDAERQQWRPKKVFGVDS